MKHSLGTIVVFAAVIVLAVPTAGLSADDEHEGGRSINDILAVIREQQHVTNNGDINAATVSDDLLAELGEAVMDAANPNEREHEWMDNMMGGEGSQSLRSAHIMMGYRYLTGGSRDDGSFPGGIMGRGWSMPMMGGWNGWGRGHRSFFTGWGFPILVTVVILVVGGVIVAFVLVGRRRGVQEHTHESALDILNKRLAKGEVTKEEYENIKREIV
jgi:putative membrane protein